MASKGWPTLQHPPWYSEHSSTSGKVLCCSSRRSRVVPCGLITHGVPVTLPPLQGKKQTKPPEPTEAEKEFKRKSWWWLAGALLTTVGYILFSNRYLSVSVCWLVCFRVYMDLISGIWWLHHWPALGIVISRWSGRIRNKPASFDHLAGLLFMASKCTRWPRPSLFLFLAPQQCQHAIASHVSV